MGVAVPFATGRFIDAIALRYSPFVPFAILSSLLLAKAVISPILQRFIFARARNVETDLQFKVLRAAMDFQPFQLAEVADGEFIAKLTRDVYAIGGFVRNFYPQLLQAVVMMFAAGFALYSRSMVLSVAFVAFFPIAILLFIPFIRRFSENSHRVRSQSDVSFNALFDFLLNLPFLRMVGAERRFADLPQGAFKSLKSSNDATDSLSVGFGFLLGALLVVGEIAVLGIAGAFAVNGRIPVGDVVLYQMLFIAAIQAVQGVISLLPGLSAICEGADSLGEVLGRGFPESGKERIDALERLEFDKVAFAYSHSVNSCVISDFSAAFDVGSVVGVSGVNGAGKSTLLKLAIGALRPQNGEIRVNGYPLASLDLSSFRRRIGVVFQDNRIIAGTIRDNITLRDREFTSQDIMKAIELSGFKSVVERLPDGLDTVIDNRSRNLSGGERQRLAIARAIIRDPMILVLDEATNHLDAEARKALANLIERLRANRLTLLAGHDAELNGLCDAEICLRKNRAMGGCSLHLVNQKKKGNINNDTK